MELVEYAQAVDHSRMPLLLRVLNALGWYAFLADIPLMAYAYCLVMARNGFPNLTMDEGRLVGASVLLPFAALALMSPAENWNPKARSRRPWTSMWATCGISMVSRSPNPDIWTRCPISPESKDPTGFHGSGTGGASKARWASTGQTSNCAITKG